MKFCNNPNTTQLFLRPVDKGLMIVKKDWELARTKWLGRTQPKVVRPEASQKRGPKAASRASARVSFEGPDPRIKKLMGQGDLGGVWDRMMAAYYRYVKRGRIIGE